MTIKVTVKNEDSRETAVISVEIRQLTHMAHIVARLKGGESCEQWVHSTQQLVVREVGQ